VIIAFVPGIGRCLSAASKPLISTRPRLVSGFLGANIAMAALQTTIGAIETAYRISKELRALIQRYANARQSAAKIFLFGGELNELRLRLFLTALKFQSPEWFARAEARDIAKAAEQVSADLNKAIEYFRDRDPSGTFNRMYWALWSESEVARRFQDVQNDLGVLEGIISLAELAPKKRPLDEGNFREQDPKKRDILYNCAAGYCIKADWIPENIGAEGPARRLYDVFVESYGREFGENNPVRAEAKSRDIAEKLWWSFETNNAALFQTGLLPCIGYQKHKIMFLLPRNVSKRLTLRHLFLEYKNKGSVSYIPSVESRFAFALQLAEAVLKIHSAGLTHNAIRSDTILVLVPANAVQNANSSGAMEASAARDETGHDEQSPEPNMELARKSTFKNLKRRLTGKTRTKKAGDPGKHKQDVVQKGQLPRVKSNISLRSNKHGNRLTYLWSKGGVNSGKSLKDREEITTPATNVHDEPSCSIVSNTTPTQVGDIPSGLPSLYLIHWYSMDRQGGIMKRRNPEWRKDIYRHPKQQGNTIDSAPNMGHDIYSLGVCLLEIALWEPLVAEIQANNPAGSTRISAFFAQAANLKGTASEQKENLKQVYNRPDGPDAIKDILIEIASRQVPSKMGTKYARIIKACLTCFDHGNNGMKEWEDVDFQGGNRGANCQAFRNIVLESLQNINAAFSIS
jgi:hypothetical protein